MEGRVVSGDGSVGGKDCRPAEQIIRLDVTRALRLAGPVLQLALQAAGAPPVDRGEVAGPRLHARFPSVLAGDDGDRVGDIVVVRVNQEQPAVAAELKESRAKPTGEDASGRWRSSVIAVRYTEIGTRCRTDPAGALNAAVLDTNFHLRPAELEFVQKRGPENVRVADHHPTGVAHFIARAEPRRRNFREKVGPVCFQVVEAVAPIQMIFGG